MASEKSAVILIADGTEEMEFTITYDTLVRAGVSCRSAYVRDPDAADGGHGAAGYATCSRGIRIVYDAVFDASEFQPSAYDALIIPGGAKGAATMAGSTAVQKLVCDFLKQGKVVGMICAGSLTALSSKLARQPLTSHPSVKAQLENHFEYSEDSVVVSGNLITSRGPGTTFPFALTLVEHLYGDKVGADKRRDVRGPMVFPPSTPF
ncbi:DJ-1 [Mycena maculata]|uniref:D-lactate dehydratase n=1 Tax=Mycena maculata TaxID=230809 RepID=A0AAD7NCT2_9AGAR|nr:DJ-1 [Mycena maculata]